MKVTPADYQRAQAALAAFSLVPSRRKTAQMLSRCFRAVDHLAAASSLDRTAKQGGKELKRIRRYHSKLNVMAAAIQLGLLDGPADRGDFERTILAELKRNPPQHPD